MLRHRLLAAAIGLAIPLAAATTAEAATHRHHPARVMTATYRHHHHRTHALHASNRTHLAQMHRHTTLRGS